MASGGVHVVARIAAEQANDGLEWLDEEGVVAVREGDGWDTANSLIGAMFMTGVEFGLRMALVASPKRLRLFLREMLEATEMHDATPLELREESMMRHIDEVLEVPPIVDGKCPDCEGEPLFDEATRHMVCGGCGQLLRFPQ